MRIQLKTFEVKCDRCSATETITARSEFDALPKNWKTLTSSGWGMTDYTRSEDLCPKCFHKENKQK